jgi:L-aminopeptidase/D-esterase-like protein
VRVGHASSARGLTGCTVLLGPFRAAADVRGLATGTREIDALSPTHLVPQIDAVLLTGGSAFGLGAADGVMQWVVEHGGGFDTGIARVPIVPAAVIFDLTAEREAPDAVLGRAACEAASTEPVGQGRVGAGTGATIGKIRGREFASPGGVGSFALMVGEFTIGAIAVVNALGDVVDFDGRIIAGARTAEGAFVNALSTLSRGEVATVGPRAATNTTLAAVATDAPLSRGALQMLARSASCAITRRIAPANTPFDGDIVFALATTTSPARETRPDELLVLGAAAQLALEHAILNAARNSESP